MKKIYISIVATIAIVFVGACTSDSARIEQLEAENAMLKQRLDSVGKVAIQLVDEAEKARRMAEQRYELAIQEAERANQKADSIKLLKE